MGLGFLLLALATLLSPARGYRNEGPSPRQGCALSGNGGTLECSARSLSPDFWNSTSLSPATTRLRLRCNDKLFFESSLSGAGWRLPALESLGIEACKIRRLGPSAFSGLNRLSSLSIRSGNGEWGSSVGLELEPGTFSGLPPTFASLDLSWNNMWTFPALCPHLASLRSLNVSSNGLTEVSVEGEACDPGLLHLDLSHNRVRAIGRNAFSRLRSLLSLRLQNNYVEELSDSGFAGLADLRLLNLSTNRLVALPPSVFTSVTGLRELYLQNNSLSVLSPALLAGLESLQVLDLSRNSLTSLWVKDSVFAPLKRLIVLKLSHNQLTYIDPSLLSGLERLQALHLDNNRLENLNPAAFVSMSSLVLLDLSRNRLTFVDSRLLATTVQLRQLYLDHNRIRTMDDDCLKNCSGLVDIGLAGNVLQAVPTALRAGLHFLRTLDIGENRIGSLSNESFTGLGQLYGLRLVDNRVTELPDDLCEPLKKLRVLNLAQNRIGSVSVSAFLGCPELRALRLDTNALEELPAYLAPQLPSLLWLNVSENRLRWADYHLLPPSLEWLDLSHNALETLGGSPGEAESGSYHLRVLDASHNRLSELDYTTIPPTLETLRLNYNQLTLVAPDTFGRSARLRRLELIGNRLENLPLSALRFPTFPLSSPLPEAYLGGNPFSCDCSMEWLTRVNQLAVLRQHPRILDLDAITCKPTYSRTAEVVHLPDAKPANFLCPYTAHCFPLCHCCEFDACDCAMTCPTNCSCFHDTAWSANIVECSGLDYTEIPDRIPMDATEIYLDGNRLPSLGSHIFIGKKNLRVLYLNDSGVEVIRNKTFNGLRSLEILRLNRNRLTVLHGYEFGDTENLRELYLQDNALASIGPNTFSSLKFLQVLRLDGNRLIDFSVWALSGNGYLNSVMLARNLWTCDCEFVIPFRTWVSSRSSIVVDFPEATCVEGNLTSSLGTLCPTLEDLSYTSNSLDEVHEESLAEKRDGGQGVMSPAGPLPEDSYSSSSVIWTALVLSTASLTLLIVLLVVFRKEVSYWLCLRRQAKRAPDSLEDDTEEKLFDAYFLYSPADEELLTQKLLPELPPALRLCLHRDLTAGLENPWNPEMVQSAAGAAKRVVILLSKPFLQSEWSSGPGAGDFRRTLQSTLSRHSRKLILVLLPPLNAASLGPLSTIYPELSSSCPRLSWTDTNFWTRFKKALPTPTGSTLPLRRTPEWPYTNFPLKPAPKDLWAPPTPHQHQHFLQHPLLLTSAPAWSHLHGHHVHHEAFPSVSTISNSYRPSSADPGLSDSTNTLGSSSGNEEEHLYSTLDTPVGSPGGSPAKRSTDSGVSSNPNGSGPMYFV